MDWSNGWAGKLSRCLGVGSVGIGLTSGLVIGDNESEILKMIRNEAASV